MDQLKYLTILMNTISELETSELWEMLGGVAEQLNKQLNKDSINGAAVRFWHMIFCLIEDDINDDLSEED